MQNFTWYGFNTNSWELGFVAQKSTRNISTWCSTKKIPLLKFLDFKLGRVKVIHISIKHHEKQRIGIMLNVI